MVWSCDVFWTFVLVVFVLCKKKHTSVWNRTITFIKRTHTTTQTRVYIYIFIHITSSNRIVTFIKSNRRRYFDQTKTPKKHIDIYLKCQNHWTTERPASFLHSTSPGIDRPAQKCRWASGSSPPWRRPTLDPAGTMGSPCQPSGWWRCGNMVGL